MQKMPQGMAQNRIQGMNFIATYLQERFNDFEISNAFISKRPGTLGISVVHSPEKKNSEVSQKKS